MGILVTQLVDGTVDGGGTSTLAKLLRNLPEMLLHQYEYEEASVRGGQQLLHSTFLQVPTVSEPLSLYRVFDGFPFCL